MANNADWLLNLNYVDFLRDIGVYFSVNRMLTAECYKKRLEVGLTFLEFNYMLMQSYDFLELFRRYNCRTADRRGRPVEQHPRRRGPHPPQGARGRLRPDQQADHDRRRQQDGQDRERRAVAGSANAPRPTSSTSTGATCRTTDVEMFLKLLTFLPMDEVRRLGALRDTEINEAKKVLAFEMTRLIHGEEEAQKGGRRGGGAVRRAGQHGQRADLCGDRGEAGGGRPPDHLACRMRPVQKPRRSPKDGGSGRGDRKRRKNHRYSTPCSSPASSARTA